MDRYASSIKSHYGQPDLEKNILTAYKKSGKNIKELNRDDLASVDEFHIRGREATRELAILAKLGKNMQVLDLGCGIGGPARTLAAEYGCLVTGIDLIEEYCQTAEMLTEMVNLSDSVKFRQGNILEMPFDDNRYDVAWSQHITMNIEDKDKLFKEVYRVLKPDGLFALYEICKGSNSPIRFPVPWAGDQVISFLVETTTFRRMLGKNGFSEKNWIDVTKPSLQWFKNLMASMIDRPKDSSPLLGINLLMGKTTPQKAGNVVTNLEEDRIRVIKCIMQKPA